MRLVGSAALLFSLVSCRSSTDSTLSDLKEKLAAQTDPLPLFRNCTCASQALYDSAQFPAYANWPATWGDCVKANEAAVKAVLEAKVATKRFAFGFATNASSMHNLYWFVQPDSSGVLYLDTYHYDPSKPLDDEGYHAMAFSHVDILAEENRTESVCGQGGVTWTPLTVVLDGADVKKVPSTMGP